MCVSTALCHSAQLCLSSQPRETDRHARVTHTHSRTDRCAHTYWDTHASRVLFGLVDNCVVFQRPVSVCAVCKLSVYSRTPALWHTPTRTWKAHTHTHRKRKQKEARYFSFILTAEILINIPVSEIACIHI